jgi:hypothetical protein
MSGNKNSIDEFIAFIRSIISNIDIEIANMYDKDNDKEICLFGTKHNNITCISLYVLVYMAIAYNIENPNNIINNIDIIKNEVITRNDLTHEIEFKKYLIYELYERLKSRCGNSQICWTNQTFFNNLSNDIKKQLIYDTWAPPAPKLPYDWLSSIDIEGVLYGVGKVYTKFFSHGCVPIDFKDYAPFLSFCNYDKRIEQGYTKYGTVINLDPHDKGGSHWTALYYDFDLLLIVYYNSDGRKYCSRVGEFIEKLKKTMVRIKNATIPDVTVIVNSVQHQYKNTECGVYCLRFIILLLKICNTYKPSGNFKNDVNLIKTSIEKMLSEDAPDDKIHKCRRQYFSSSNTKKDDERLDVKDPTKYILHEIENTTLSYGGEKKGKK